MNYIEKIQLNCKELKVKHLNKIISAIISNGYGVDFDAESYGFNHLRYCKKAGKFIFSYSSKRYELVGFKLFKKLLKKMPRLSITDVQVDCTELDKQMLDQLIEVAKSINGYEVYTPVVGNDDVFFRYVEFSRTQKGFTTSTKDKNKITITAVQFIDMFGS